MGDLQNKWEIRIQNESRSREIEKICGRTYLGARRLTEISGRLRDSDPPSRASFSLKQLYFDDEKQMTTQTCANACRYSYYIRPIQFLRTKNFIEFKKFIFCIPY